MTKPHSARTAAACRIAGMDRQKLTDAIASGDYPCAPFTSAGRARVFSKADLIALALFRTLTTLGHPARLAGRLACGVGERLKQEPEAEFVRIVQPSMGSGFTTTDPVIDPAETYVSGLPIFSHTTYDLRPIRRTIEAGLEAEDGVVGGEDDAVETTQDRTPS